MTVVMMRLSIRGFIVTDFIEQGKAQAAVKMFVDSVKEGKLKIGDEQETVVDTKFEDIPKTWLKLFEGSNQGKLVTKLQW
jgi:NADPH-dependent curcumin reductase CurA